MCMYDSLVAYFIYCCDSPAGLLVWCITEQVRFRCLDFTPVTLTNIGAAAWGRCKDGRRLPAGSKGGDSVLRLRTLTSNMASPQKNVECVKVSKRFCTAVRRLGCASVCVGTGGSKMSSFEPR